MDTKKIFETLRKVAFFSELSDNELMTVAENTVSKNYKTGEIIYKSGTLTSILHVIAEGEVILVKPTDLGLEDQMALFSINEAFSVAAVVDQSVHANTGKAVMNSVILEITHAFFKANPLIVAKLAPKVVERLNQYLRKSNNRNIRSVVYYTTGKTRQEHDSLGFKDINDEYYFGVQTLRALENFNITGVPMSAYPAFIRGLAIVKLAACRANCEMGILPKEKAEAIEKACIEVMKGKFDYHFPVDMIQGGAGTSANMNANEVIANRALELMGHKKGEYDFCHPNNDVNMSQSTNDAYPTSLKLGVYFANRELVKVLNVMICEFDKKAKEFAHIIKMGRTQFQDAIPMTLGQTFGAFANTLKSEVRNLNRVSHDLLEVNMGATAIGTGLCSEPGYAELCVKHLCTITSEGITLSHDLVEATSDTSSFVTYMAALKRLGTKMHKICTDLRLLSSGPRCGLNEINLPPMQPGSSIMPGKVNPVMPEVMSQVAIKAFGNDMTVTVGSAAAQLELNAMEPAIGQCILESIDMFKAGVETFTYRCVSGITANEKRCREYVENSIGLVTALNPYIGYEASASIAKEALKTGGSVYDLALERGLLTKEEIETIMLPENMVKPTNIPGIKRKF